MLALYAVGGCVRDEILGVQSKDIDFAVEAPSFEAMREFIIDAGGKIYLEKPEFLTIRAKLEGIDADFVVCRKEADYSDGRRPDSVAIGSIIDDLSRRDFTMNAIARPMRLCHMGLVPSSSLLDPFGGIEDIDNRTVRCVGNPADRFNEDSLRMLRAIRFAITKDFGIHADTANAMWNPDIVKRLINVSKERIREELLRCFRHNTLKTIHMLDYFPLVRDAVFDDNVLWLKPTLEG